MQLKSLELLGFKSFVERTRLDFGQGVTIVVGPNGCGKSNVVDAIRWVMGEQSAKHLRGGSMEDVIFSGSAKRSPLGMAEVFLTFDNNKGLAPANFASCAEIEIGRRLYRSGESEYFINRMPAKLKDVQTFFMGTGLGSKAYSIVEQGMIGTLITARPEDKRKVIEEAAGISKFKNRRDLAQRRMESTKANLLRLNDIIDEISKQVNSLDRQAKKAKKFEELKIEIENKELTFLSTKYVNLSTTLKDAENDRNLKSENETVSKAKVSTFEAKLDQLRLELIEKEQQLETIQRELYSAESQLRLDEAEISHRQREKDELEGNIKLWEEETSELSERLKHLEEKLKVVNDEKVQSDCLLAEMNTNLASSEEQLLSLSNDESFKRQNLTELQNEKQKLLEEKAKTLATIEEQKKQQTESEVQLQDLNRQKAELEERRRNLETLFANIKSEFGSVDESARRFIAEEKSLFEEVEQKKIKVKELEEKLLVIRQTYQEKSSRLEAFRELEKAGDDLSDGLKKLLEKSKNSEEFKGVVGTISDLVEVDAGFETATSAILGDKMQFVVVESQKYGIEAVQFLKNVSEGRGTFVSTEVMSRISDVTPDGEGIIGKLSSHVNLLGNFKSIGDYLFGDVIIAKNLDTAIDSWAKHRCTYVTPEGEVVDSHGVITGGPGGKKMKFFSHKNRIKELEEEIKEAKNILDLSESELLVAKNTLKDVEMAFENARTLTHSEQMKKLSGEKDIQRTESELQTANNHYQNIINSISKSEAIKEEKHKEISTKILFASDLDNKIDGLISKITEADEILKTSSNFKKNAEEETTKIRIKQAEAKSFADKTSQQSEELASSKAVAYLELERRKSLLSFGKRRIISIGEEQSRLRDSLSNAVKKSATLENEQRTLRAKYDELASEVRKLDVDLRALRNGHEILINELHKCEVELAKQRSDVEHITSRALELYHKSLSEMANQYFKEDLDFEKEAVEIAELKEKIEKLGGFDAEALLERDGLHQRLEFMLKQREDLSSSLDALNKAIIRINETSRDRFKQTFEAVDTEFQKLFPKLFRGGSAKLVMLEGDLLEAGVEIMAQPPGKRLQAMSLLSGGEKALTAVALVFAIFLVKPSPFCLLDEVDAPLDDVNIDRFNRLVKSMTNLSQFVIITHNKRTMELADMIYGVTMPEPGVSKIVSAKLTEMVESEQKSA